MLLFFLFFSFMVLSIHSKINFCYSLPNFTIRIFSLRKVLNSLKCDRSSFWFFGLSYIIHICSAALFGYSLQRVGKKSVNAKINRKKNELFLKIFIFRFSNGKVYGLIIFRLRNSKLKCDIALELRNFHQCKTM